MILYAHLSRFLICTYLDFLSHCPDFVIVCLKCILCMCKNHDLNIKMNSNLYYPHLGLLFFLGHTSTIIHNEMRLERVDGNVTGMY